MRCVTTLLLLVSACGGVTQPAETVLREVESSAQIGGMEVITLPRPTPSAVHLSLFVDAGFHDADLPQVATVLAWSLSDDQITGAALPDGLRFDRSCESSEIESCLASLWSVFDPPTEDRFRSAVVLLAPARARATASPFGAADRLALEAVLGKPGPFGDPSQDGEVTLEHILSFHREHMGRDRALLVAAGDVSTEPFLQTLRGAVSSVRRADSVRSERTGETQDGSVSFEPGEAFSATAALVLPSAEDAAAAHSLAQARHPEGLRAVLFPIRSSTLLLLSVSDPAHLEELGHTARLLTSANIRESASSAPRLPAGVLPAIDFVGARWISRGPVLGQTAVGVGFVGNELLEGAHRQVLSEALSSSTTELSPHHQITFSGRDSDQFALMLAVPVGSRSESAASHGRGAIVAARLSRACARPGWQVEGVNQRDRTGLAIAAPTADWRLAVEHGLACLLRSSFSSRDVEDARREVLHSFTERDRMSALAAQALSPQFPGAIAPRGSRRGLEVLSPATIRRFGVGLSSPPGVIVHASGSIAPRVVEGFLEQRLALVRVTPLPTSAATELRADTMIGVQAESISPRVVVSWTSSSGDANSARAFAYGIGEQLTRNQALVVTYADGGVHLGQAWAAIGFATGTENLDLVPAQIADAEHSPDLQARATAWTLRSRLSQSGAVGFVTGFDAPPTSPPFLPGEARFLIARGQPHPEDQAGD